MSNDTAINKANTRLLFSDIDGTLIRKDQTVSGNVSASLKKMADAGHGLILSSGRPLGSILKVYEYIISQVGRSFPNAYIIANNGAQVYDIAAEKNIFEKRIPLSVVDSIQDLAESMNVHIQTYTETNIICTRDDDETKLYKRRIILPVTFSERLADALTDPPYKMLALSTEGSEPLMPFKQKMAEGFGDHIQTFFSGPGYLEIIDKNADKGNALRFVAEHLNIPLMNTFAAGDSENDLPMLLAAGHGYAMKNAEKLLLDKSLGLMVTARDHENDGMIEVIDDLMR